MESQVLLDQIFTHFSRITCIDQPRLYMIYNSSNIDLYLWNIYFMEKINYTHFKVEIN